MAIIYDVSVTTVYKKFPAGENENIARRIIERGDLCVAELMQNFFAP
ncbi:hypothetical protein OkiPb00508_24910 [Escherichia coli]